MKILACCVITAITSLSLTATDADAQDGLSQSLCKVTDTIGMSVKDSNRNDVGKIEDIVLDRTSGRVKYAVLSHGGFLGMGESHYAVPWHAFKKSTDQGHLVLAFSKNHLYSAPGFNKDNWPDMANPTWTRQIEQFYTQAGQTGHGDIDLNTAGVERKPLKLDLRMQETATYTYVLSSRTSASTSNSPGNRRGGDDVQDEVDDSADSPRRNRESGMAKGLKECRVKITVDKVTPQQIGLTCRTAVSGESEQTFHVLMSPRGEIASLTNRTETRRDGSSEAAGGQHLRTCLAYIFGNGLHQEELQPSQKYDIPRDLCGSMGEMAWDRPRSTDRPRGGPSGDEKAGPEETSRTGQKSVSLQFEGTKDINGHRCAIFSGMGSSVRADSKDREVLGATRVGVVAYRVSDGLLERAYMQPSANDATNRVVLRRDGALVN